jgi:hypothetical protein
MRITNRQLGTFALGLTVGVALVAGSGIASAATSFTYQTFQKLIGTNNVVPISPSYSYATQLQQPSVTAASSTPGGSLTGGRIVAEVVATTPFGTSSPSAEIATTTNPSTSLQLSWPTIPGATGYAVYFGTTTPGSEQAYLVATSTNGAVNTYYTLTSTTSPNYDVRPHINTGFYTQLGSASSSIATAGNIQTSAAATTTSCTAALNGSIFYNTANAHLWLCTGAGPTWALIK